jgi:C4-dicarboxylate-specific signal transduction histidine kinase
LAQPLRRQIVFLNLAILVNAFVVIAWSARETYREHLVQLENESRAMSATILVYLQRGMDMRAVQTVIDAIPLPYGSVITITDANSIVLARSSEPERFVGHRVESAPRLIHDVPTSEQRPGMDGVERMYANAVFAPGPWLVSVGMPTDVAYRRVVPIVVRTVAISIGVAVFTLSLQFVLLGSYTRAFDRALRYATRVSNGQLDPPTPIKMPSREMEQLQSSFIDMVTKLREAQQAVAAQVIEERRIREELQLLQRQLIRQERLAAIGVLVSGVAHELNNPLQAILGFADLLQMRKDLPPHAMEEIALIQKESERANAIIRNLSRFSRQQTADPSAVRLRDVVASVVELRKRQLEEQGIELEVRESHDATVMAVFAELQQVALNFMVNAEQSVIERMPPRHITIKLTGGNGRAHLEVRDNGRGVPPENEAKLFQPFFTTKPVGKGTGLGLSVSYGIIQAHGGTIGYQPAPDGGAVFYFELQALEPAPQKT